MSGKEQDESSLFPIEEKTDQHASPFTRRYSVIVSSNIPDVPDSSRGLFVVDHPTPWTALLTAAKVAWASRKYLTGQTEAPNRPSSTLK